MGESICKLIFITMLYNASIKKYCPEQKNNVLGIVNYHTCSTDPYRVRDTIFKNLIGMFFKVSFTSNFHILCYLLMSMKSISSQILIHEFPFLIPELQLSNQDVL